MPSFRRIHFAKTIGGQIYFYHQWSESGTKKSRYLKNEEISGISELIEKRKALQDELKETKAALAGLSKKPELSHISCTLMHKNTPVADLDLDRDNGFIKKIRTVYATEHLPLGVKVRNGIADKNSFNDWWTERSIPASRSGVREALETMGIADTKALLIRSFGLSLSDQYWICPEGSNLSWKDINFFENDFSEDIGDVLFGFNKKSNAINFSSPDNTSDGNREQHRHLNTEHRVSLTGVFVSIYRHFSHSRQPLLPVTMGFHRCSAGIM